MVELVTAGHVSGKKVRSLEMVRKRKKGKEATVTETREHSMEERARERRVFNDTAERWSLFTVGYLCCQKETGTERRKEGG